jgi:KaiC/GvpD/RAD55 family RecA-like ATPase
MTTFTAEFSPEFKIPFEAYFVDRQEELNLLSNAVLEKNKFVWIYGRAGAGKTALLYQFARKYKEHFNANRTDITSVYARNFIEVKQKIHEALEKVEHQNTLLLIDESEQLTDQQIDEIISIKRQSDRLKLIFSSRTKPQIKSHYFHRNCHFLSLKSPDLFSVLQKRIQILKDTDLKSKARTVFDEYLNTAQHSDKTTREVLNELNQLIHNYPDAGSYVKSNTISVKKDEVGNVFEIKIDYVGIIFSLILFLVSQFSANRSEKYISDKIDNVKNAIESVVSIYKSENENLFFVNRRVNLREKPNTKNSTVLRILEVNALVTLINKKDGWVYVKYSDYSNNLEQYGWVYEKYLSRKVRTK